MDGGRDQVRTWPAVRHGAAPRLCESFDAFYQSVYECDFRSNSYTYAYEFLVEGKGGASQQAFSGKALERPRLAVKPFRASPAGAALFSGPGRPAPGAPQRCIGGAVCV